ncbi:unnamed protein product [Didymodactylos carnosus]|uniref:Uncharacterized protein n=1 Tax=Didymodactylos carnosus TaxID=1234261 RepID=A0A8S2IT52_9BILA|nr:unnamed protein product [Didymodactylos carnosus]CAF3772206.1 unnamed protein product [Didymodactylos carnosus]
MRDVYLNNLTQKNKYYYEFNVLADEDENIIRDGKAIESIIVNNLNDNGFARFVALTLQNRDFWEQISDKIVTKLYRSRDNLVQYGIKFQDLIWDKFNNLLRRTDSTSDKRYKLPSTATLSQLVSLVQVQKQEHLINLLIISSGLREICYMQIPELFMCRTGKPGAVDRYISSDLDRFESVHKPPTVVLISDDITFICKLSDLRHQIGYNVIVGHNLPAKVQLKATVNSHYDWSQSRIQSTQQNRQLTIPIKNDSSQLLRS